MVHFSRFYGSRINGIKTLKKPLKSPFLDVLSYPQGYPQGYPQKNGTYQQVIRRWLWITRKLSTDIYAKA